MLPDRIVAFIRQSIRSVWDLELLFALRRAADKGLTSGQLVVEVRGSQMVVASSLLNLKAAGLVKEADGIWRYAPATDEIESLVRELAEFHANYPFAIAEAIWSRPDPKLTVFANAFRLKKD